MYEYTLKKYMQDINYLFEQINNGLHSYKFVYGIPQGGTLPALSLSNYLNIPLITDLRNIEPESVLIVDDLIDSGNTIAVYANAGYPVAVLGIKDTSVLTGNSRCFYARNFPNQWIHFWWEPSIETGNGSIHDNITRILSYIGEDTQREGLKETPKRVVKSWDKLYEGYGKNPAAVMKVFEDGACDEMVLLKDIELYSMCEHHILPFFGRCHIAYIPNKKVIGISKLARLMEIYARRMQIQERIGNQITSALMEHLQPLGAACIIEATHFCMKARGIEKQNSIMVTSSLKGLFRTEPAVRAEFMGLVK